MNWLDPASHPNHVGLVCSRPQAWRRAVFSFLAQGLKQGERCVYLTTLHTPKTILYLLAQEGVDVERAQAQGRFQVKDACRTYMPHGWFEPGPTIERHAQAAEQALDDGHAGLRAVGDMAWACYQSSIWDQLLEYEARVDQELFARYPIKAMCFYDRPLFDRHMIGAVEGLHPALVDEQSALAFAQGLGLPAAGGPLPEPAAPFLAVRPALA